MVGKKSKRYYFIVCEYYLKCECQCPLFLWTQPHLFACVGLWQLLSYNGRGEWLQCRLYGPRSLNVNVWPFAGRVCRPLLRGCSSGSEVAIMRLEASLPPFWKAILLGRFQPLMSVAHRCLLDSKQLSSGGVGVGG